MDPKSRRDMLQLKEAVEECLAVCGKMLNEDASDGEKAESSKELSQMAADACSSDAKLKKLVQKNDALVQKKASKLSGKAKAVMLKAWNAIKLAAKGVKAAGKLTYRALEVLRKYWLPLLLVTVFLACKYELVREGAVKVIDLALKLVMWITGYGKGYSSEEAAKLVDVSGNVPEGIRKKALEDIKKYSKVPGGFYDQGSF